MIWDAVVLVLHANSRDWWLFSVGFTPLLFPVGSQTLQVHARVFLNQNLLVGFGEDVCKDVSSMCWLVFLARSRWDGPTIKPSAQLRSAFSRWWKYGCCFHLGSYENSRRALGERHMPNLLNSVPLDVRSGLYSYRYYLRCSSVRIYWRQLSLVFGAGGDLL